MNSSPDKRRVQRLTVAVCSFNRCSGLDKTLRSITNAVRPERMDVEIIVVNNNSTDDTEEVTRRYTKTDKRVIGLFEGSQGVAYARNAAIAAAKGEYIAFTDDDVLVDANWLVDLERVIQEERPACVGGKVLPLWENGKPDWLGSEFYPMLALLDFHSDRVRLEIPKLWTANMCTSVQVARQLGGFNSKKGPLANQLFRGEDTAYVQSVLDAGESVFYDPAPTVWHRIGPDRIRKAYFRKWRYDSARGRTRHEQLSRPLSAHFFNAIGSLGRQVVSRRIWIGTEKSRLLNQMEVMSAAGRVMGLLDRSLPPRERRSSV